MKVHLSKALYAIKLPKLGSLVRRRPGSHFEGSPCPASRVGPVNQSKFTAEMAIHFPGLKNIDKPVVWVFPELVVCLDCGTADLLCRKLNCANLQKATPTEAG